MTSKGLTADALRLLPVAGVTASAPPAAAAAGVPAACPPSSAAGTAAATPPAPAAAGPGVGCCPACPGTAALGCAGGLLLQCLGVANSPAMPPPMLCCTGVLLLVSAFESGCCLWGVAAAPPSKAARDAALLPLPATAAVAADVLRPLACGVTRTWAEGGGVSLMLKRGFFLAAGLVCGVLEGRPRGALLLLREEVVLCSLPFCCLPCCLVAAAGAAGCCGAAAAGGSWECRCWGCWGVCRRLASSLLLLDDATATLPGV